MVLNCWNSTSAAFTSFFPNFAAAEEIIRIYDGAKPWQSSLTIAINLKLSKGLDHLEGPLAPTTAAAIAIGAFPSSSFRLPVPINYSNKSSSRFLLN